MQVTAIRGVAEKMKKGGNNAALRTCFICLNLIWSSVQKVSQLN